MCLAIPMNVKEINGNMGIVESQGVRREVGLMLMDDLKVGDWVLIHAGFAISKLNETEAEETMALLREAELIE
jgi:hydrogenase expression/formation protein HypC